MELENWVGIGVAVVAILFLSRVFLFSHQQTAAIVPSTPKGKEEEEKKKKKRAVFLNRERQKVPLVEKISLSHDTRLFRFGLSSPEMELGLPIGKHLKFFAPNVKGVKEGEWNGRPDPDQGEEIQRSYTPTSCDADLGHFDLVVKIYKKGEKPQFPDGGKASQYLDSLTIGQEVEVSGPYGLIEYLGAGRLTVSRKEKPIMKHIGMIAGGTGITPMLQVIAAVLKEPADSSPTLSLLFANQTEEDILVREMLESLQEKHPARFRLWYTLDRPPQNWKYSSGFINEEMIRSHLPAPNKENTCVLLCGPPPMIKFACEPNLEKVGFTKEEIFAF